MKKVLAKLGFQLRRVERSISGKSDYHFDGYKLTIEPVTYIGDNLNDFYRIQFCRISVNNEVLGMASVTDLENNLDQVITEYLNLYHKVQ